MTRLFQPTWNDQLPPPEFDESGQILCSVCRSSMVHIEACSVIQNKKAHMITREDVFVTEGEEPLRACRGSEIRIAMYCEEGHRFGVVFAFHKGSTTAECYEGPWFDVANEDEYPTELWRD